MARIPFAVAVLLAVSASAQDAGVPDDPRIDALTKKLEALQAELDKRVPTQPLAVAPQPIANLGEATKSTGPKAELQIGGYVEIPYQWNFNEPSNFVTNYRGFDNRHNMFTVENATLDARGSLGPLSAHVAMQFGLAPETYYLAEPVSHGTSAAGTTGPSVWKFLQQANLAYVAPLGRGLTIDGGLFLSPIGPEGLAIRDQWNWSRSDLFFGLPFYHAGVRATYPLTERWTASLQLYNGWNSVVDNNPELSPAFQLTYNDGDKVTFNALYFGGVERNVGAPEGRAWRNLFDTYLQVTPLEWLQLLAHFDGGFEPNHFGISSWLAGALYARVHPFQKLYFTARADYFHEGIAKNADGQAAPIFWSGAAWIASGTLTADYRPADNISVRLEFRHDEAQKDLFFAGQVPMSTDGFAIPNARTQNTLTVGAVAWF
jgi:hypothetical protein